MLGVCDRVNPRTLPVCAATRVGAVVRGRVRLASGPVTVRYVTNIMTCVRGPRRGVVDTGLQWLRDTAWT